MVRRISFVCFTVMAISVFTSAEDTVVSVSEEKAVPAAEASFTLEQLAEFNGTNGKDAYIAVDGIVYNVTEAKAWKKGEHKGGKTGTDISEKITKSPHKKKVLDKLPKVGILVKEEEKK